MTFEVIAKTCAAGLVTCDWCLFSRVTRIPSSHLKKNILHITTFIEKIGRVGRMKYVGVLTRVCSRRNVGSWIACSHLFMAIICS